MKRIQLISVALLAGVIAAGLALDVPLWAVTLAIVCVVAMQLALELRHYRRTGEVCSSVRIDRPEVPTNQGRV